LGHLVGDGVGGDGDEAAAAEGDDGEGEGVVAGEDAEGARALGEELSDLDDVAGGFLDADDGWVFGEAEDGIGFEIGAGAAGNVVEQDGKFGGLGDG
jgi:hypothetical protein